MNNKEDWEELEKWQERRKEEQMEKFRVDFSEIAKKREYKGVNTIVKGMKIAGKTIKIGEIITIIIVIASVLLIFDLIISNINAKTNVKPEKTIENMYNTKIDLIYKDIDEKENGKYVFQVSDNNEIQFTAIRKFGSLSEDYSDNCHKYYFERWESKEKENFIIIENKTEDILDYDTYIEIDSYEELEKAMDIINNFVNYCGNNFSANWRIYLKKGNYIIYPYQQSGISKEDAINNAKELYNKYLK